jgi:hypothetical protein
MQMKLEFSYSYNAISLHIISIASYSFAPSSLTILLVQRKLSATVSLHFLKNCATLHFQLSSPKPK